jgi:hypothetical protein
MRCRFQGRLNREQRIADAIEKSLVPMITRNKLQKCGNIACALSTFFEDDLHVSKQRVRPRDVHTTGKASPGSFNAAFLSGIEREISLVYTRYICNIFSITFHLKILYIISAIYCV